MDDQRMAEIRARCEAATPGAKGGGWATGEHVGEPRALCPFPGGMHSLLALDKDGMAIFARAEDAVFAAHARKDVPELLAEVTRLRGAVNPAQLPQLYFAYSSDYPDEGSHVIAATADDAIRVAREAMGYDADEEWQDDDPGVGLLPFDPHEMNVRIDALEKRAKAAEAQVQALSIKVEEADAREWDLNHHSSEQRSEIGALRRALKRILEADTGDECQDIARDALSK